MGLDGTVHCNCYKQGKTKPLPFSSDLVKIDEEGWLDLLVEDSENQKLLWQWEEDCCEHPGRDYVRVRVSNWWGYHYFTDMLEKIGWEHFPVLHEWLPNANSGILPSDSAPQALAELKYFQSLPNLGTHFVLVNGDNDKILYDSAGIFVWDGKEGGIYIGFDRNGLYITDKERKKELFRALKAEQRILFKPLPGNNQQRPRVEYYNRDTGVSFQCTTAVSGAPIPGPAGEEKDTEGRFYDYEYPRLLQVEERPLTPHYFEYILNAFTQLFEGSVITGNPIVWC